MKEEHAIQEIDDQAQRVETLEKQHEESIEDVLKDAKNIKSYWTDERKISKFIQQLTSEDIRNNSNMNFPFKISDFKLNIWMDKKNDRKLIKLLKYIKLPNIKKIEIRFRKDSEDIKSFLKYSFPDQLQYLYISGRSKSDPCLSINKHMKRLLR